jgi:hypothetical protein
LGVNILIFIFRTLQIVLLTEKGTAFLKEKFTVINILLPVILMLLLIYTAANSYLATRQPTSVGKMGTFGFVICIISSVFIFAGSISTLIFRPSAWALLFAASLGAVFGVVLFAIPQIKEYTFPKPAALLFVFFGLTSLIAAYMYYSEHPLRARTVYEITALITSELFFLCLGKAISDVKPQKNFRLLYPLGIVSSTLCFSSCLPEITATVLGFGNRVTDTSVSQFIIIGIGLFTAFVTISSFRRANTKRQ